MKKAALLFLFCLSPPILADTENAPVSIFETIKKAKVLLADKHPEPIISFSKKDGKVARRYIGKEVFRVTQKPNGELRIVFLKTLYTRDRKGRINSTIVQSTEPKECAALWIGGGGVNADFRIICDGQIETVYAGANLLVDKSGSPAKSWDGKSEAIYVPFSEALMKPEVIEAGRKHLLASLDLAEAELREEKVYSRAVRDSLVADVIPKAQVFITAQIEHIDHDEYREKSPEYAENKVFTQLGLNGEEAFAYSFSSVKGRPGAGCLMQIMPETYRDYMPAYKAAKMPRNPRQGSCESHVSAIKCAYLVLDSKLSAISSHSKRFLKLYLEDPKHYGLYLAAAYNGGEGRALALFDKAENPTFNLQETIRDLFEKLHLRKERPKMRILRKETWIFIKKYFELSAIQLKTKQ